MRLQIASIGVVALIVGIVHAQGGRANRSMPVAPSRDIRVSFPDCPDPKVPDSLSALRRCRGDLEAFRAGVLEPYHVSVDSYGKRLTQYDAWLRTEASAGHIAWAAYEEQKVTIQTGIDRAAPDGDLMAPYFELAEKLKQRSRFVIQATHECETDPRQRCSR